MERFKRFIKEWVEFMIVLYIVAGSTFGLISYYKFYEYQKEIIKEEKIMEDGQKRNSSTEGSITLYELDRQVQHNQR